MDETYTRLTNGIRDAIAPDVTMFVRYVLQENKVIQIEVGEGSYKPYYLKSKGMKPTGVYVRQGTSSVQASSDQIRRMIKDSDGDVFEEMRTVLQELSFDEAERAFKRYKVDFSEEKYIALGLRNIHDDQYTNLAMILSDQFQHTTKIAVFAMKPTLPSRMQKSSAVLSSSSWRTAIRIYLFATIPLPPSRAKRCSMPLFIATTATAAA